MLRLRTEQGNIIRANSDIFKKYIKYVFYSDNFLIFFGYRCSVQVYGWLGAYTLQMPTMSHDVVCDIVDIVGICSCKWDTPWFV